MPPAALVLTEHVGGQEICGCWTATAAALAPEATGVLATTIPCRSEGFFLCAPGFTPGRANPLALPSGRLPRAPIRHPQDLLPCAQKGGKVQKEDFVSRQRAHNQIA